jgi:hypothetical protein
MIEVSFEPRSFLGLFLGGFVTQNLNWEKMMKWRSLIPATIPFEKFLRVKPYIG